MDLSNKNILITGASKGLGKELARKLSIYKPNLILIARSSDGLESVQQEILEKTGKSPLIVKCDVSCESDVKNLSDIIRDKYEYIDILINNAGVGVHKESEAVRNEEMRKLFEVNFFGSFYLINSLLPLLKQSGTGYILNIGSLVSRVSFPENSVYAATKFALKGYTEGLRLELKKYKIKVGIIHPGLIDTSFRQLNPEISNKIPNFLFLKPEKVAAACIKMIQKRKNIKYLTKHMLWIMKLKQIMY